MDDQVVEEDPYSDDDLDALADDAFNELEEDAFRSTQQPLPPVQSRLPAFRSPNRPDAASLAGGFGRLAVGADVTHARQDQGFQLASSDYGDLDDEMLDGEIFDANEQPALAAAVQQNQIKNQLPGESTQREQWRKQRYSVPSPARPQKPAQTNGLVQTKPRAIALHPPRPEHNTSQQAHSQHAARSEVEKLMLERGELLQAIQIANDSANAKAGEIAIVRANASKLEKEYDHQTKSLQKVHADEAARQKIELDKVKAELQKITTEKKFLENDLAEGTKQVRALQKTIKKTGKQAESTTYKEGGVTTPRKSKTHLGDGFNVDEIQPISPSRLAHR